MISRFIRQPKLKLDPRRGVLIDKDRGARIKQVQHAFILSLPDELLLSIFLLACECAESPQCFCRRHCWQFGARDSSRIDCSMARYHGACNIVLVCHHFYRLGVEVLYKSLCLPTSSGDFGPNSNIWMLHRSLDENPALRSVCREVRFHLRFSRRHLGQQIMADFVSWLGKVQCLQVQGACNRTPTDLSFWSELSKQMPGVRHLSVEFDMAIRIGSLFELSIFPLLSSLTTTKHSRSGLGPTPQCPKNLMGKGSFTTLRLFEFNDTWSALYQILLWPRQLQHFVLTNPSLYCAEFDAIQCQEFLALHKRTLRSVELTSVSKFHGFDTARSCLDVSDFPNLESLFIDNWLANCSPERAAANLLAPRLRTSGWAFIPTQHRRLLPVNFEQEQEEWFLNFIKLARARESALKHVNINFKPFLMGHPHSSSLMGANEYPRDRMDRLAAAAKSLGVEVTYEKSRCSREQWYRLKAEAEAVSSGV